MTQADSGHPPLRRSLDSADAASSAPSGPAAESDETRLARLLADRSWYHPSLGSLYHRPVRVLSSGVEGTLRDAYVWDTGPEVFVRPFGGGGEIKTSPGDVQFLPCKHEVLVRDSDGRRCKRCRQLIYLGRAR